MLQKKNRPQSNKKGSEGRDGGILPRRGNFGLKGGPYNVAALDEREAAVILLLRSQSTLLKELKRQLVELPPD